MKNGELSSLAALGASKSYPNFTVLTQSEARTLVNDRIFLGE